MKSHAIRYIVIFFATSAVSSLALWIISTADKKDEDDAPKKERPVAQMVKVGGIELEIFDEFRKGTDGLEADVALRIRLKSGEDASRYTACSYRVTSQLKAPPKILRQLYPHLSFDAEKKRGEFEAVVSDRLPVLMISGGGEVLPIRMTAMEQLVGAYTLRTRRYWDDDKKAMRDAKFLQNKHGNVVPVLGQKLAGLDSWEGKEVLVVAEVGADDTEGREEGARPSPCASYTSDTIFTIGL